MRPPDSYLHWDDAALAAVESLRRAHDLVAFGWCQGADATDAEHHPVKPWSERACYWSLLGALSAAPGTPQQDMPESTARIAELRLCARCSLACLAGECQALPIVLRVTTSSMRVRSMA